MRLQHQRMHRGVLERAPAPALITTNGIVESIVFVTAPATFTGVIGGYTTLTPDSPSPTQAPQPSQASVGPNYPVSSQSQQQTQSGGYRISLQSSATASPTAAATSSTPIELSPSSSNGGNIGSSSTVGSSGATETQSTGASSTSGSSLGGKIGLAVGVISVIGIIAVLLLFFVGRKKRQQREQEQMESEKREQYQAPAVTQAMTPPSPEAPRLSLRPVSSLVPEFMGGSKPKNRLSQGNMLNNVSDASRARNMLLSQPIALVERPRPAENPFKDPENPFLDPEKATGPWMGENNVPVSPVSTNAPNKAPSVAISELTTDHHQSEPTAESFPIPQAQNHSPPIQPAPVMQPTRSVPTGASPGVTYAELPGAPAPAPIVAPGPGPDGPQSNVYRILMDFRPTMEDELELRAGQLVRMLHEYDDGWALCIRLDRSQQGVVPRTCLAAKPSKPRPGPPPAGPNSRPITPQGRPRGPPGPPGPGMGNPRMQDPASIRSQSPATVPTNAGAFNQPPRPLSPGPRPQPPVQKRSMSPGPYAAGGPQPMGPVEHKRRSNSVGAVNVRNKRESPPGPSKLGPGLPPVAPDSPGLAL